MKRYIQPIVKIKCIETDGALMAAVSGGTTGYQDQTNPSDFTAGAKPWTRHYSVWDADEE